MHYLIKSSLFIFGIGLWAFSLGCASTDTGDCTDVNQSKIYQSLNAAYDTTNNKTTATATLRFSGATGTTLNLNGSCRVTNSQYTLTKSTFLGTSYSGDGTGFTPNHSFTFTDNNSTSYTNSGVIPTVTFSGSAPTSISKSVGVTVTFTPAVAAGETVTLFISSTEGTGTVIASTNTVGATTITAASSEFTTFSLGAATIYLQKASSATPAQITEAGGIFSVTYTSSKPTVTING